MLVVCSAVGGVDGGYNGWKSIEDGVGSAGVLCTETSGFFSGRLVTESDSISISPAGLALLLFLAARPSQIWSVYIVSYKPC